MFVLLHNIAVILNFTIMYSDIIIIIIICIIF